VTRPEKGAHKRSKKKVGITEDEEELWKDTETGEAWL